MKRMSLVAAVLAIMFSALGGEVDWASAQGPAVKPVTLKAASVLPPPSVSMMSEVMKVWEDEVTKRTNGAIKFENIWGAALGAPAEHIDLVKKGTVQIAQTHVWYTPSRFPIGNFEYIYPFAPTDYVIVAKAMRQIRGEFPQFVADETRENVVMISNPPGGVYNFMSKKPLRTVADFKGEKVSLIGRYFGRWLPPGATAVVRPGGERYDLLRGGVVDTDLLAFDLAYGWKIHEVTKYYIEANLTVACLAPFIMNMDTFKGFSPEVQKIFLEVGKEMELKAAQEILPRWWNRAETDWKAKGIGFIKISEAERQKWAATLEDIPAEFAKEIEAKGYPGFKIVQRWQEITGQMGYKWPRQWGVK